MNKPVPTQYMDIKRYDCPCAVLGISIIYMKAIIGLRCTASKEYLKSNKVCRICCYYPKNWSRKKNLETLKKGRTCLAAWKKRLKTLSKY